jgi:hypothetical protein
MWVSLLVTFMDLCPCFMLASLTCSIYKGRRHIVYSSPSLYSIFVLVLETSYSEKDVRVHEETLGEREVL